MKRNCILKVVLVICIFISLIKPVYGSSVDFTTRTQKIETSSGEEIKITLKMENYEGIKKGVNAYQATIDYDENVFEPLTVSNFTSLNNWGNLKYNPENKTFIAIKKSSSTSPEDIVTIKLKVKDNLKGQESTVKIKDFIASEGKEDITYSKNVETKVKIVEESSKLSSNSGNLTNQTSNFNNFSNGTQSLENNQVIVISNKTQEDEKTNDNQVSKEDKSNDEITDEITDDTNNNQNSNGVINSDENSESSEQTELVETSSPVVKKWIIFIIILLIIILLIIFVITQKQRRKKLFGIILLVSICGFELTSIIQASIYKGELNGDGIVDYSDVTLLENHLISLKKLNDNKLDNADMNSDNNLTVTDLSLLIQKVEKKLDYKVEITDVSISNYYPQKAEELTLKMDTKINYDAKIESVTINDKEYSVTKEDDSYVVTLKAPDIAGIYELNFSKVKLEAGQSVKINHTEKVDVLKQIPSIENYTLEENALDSTLTVKFDVVDADNSISSGSVIIYDSDKEQVSDKEIVVGKNELTFKADEDEEYTVSICADYNLDTDELTENEEDNSGNLIKEETAKLVIDYKFELNKITTYNEEQKETSNFKKQEKITLGFESKNAIGFTVQNIIVDGKEYEVALKKENQYEVKLDGFSNSGKKQIKIEEIILSNGKHIAITEDNIIEISVLKAVPSIEDAKITEQDDKLLIQMNLSDEDNTMQDANIVVTDEEDEILLQKDLKAGEYKSEIDLSEKLVAQFKIKVVATYETLDSVVKNQNIYEEILDAKARINIESATVSKEYLEKNENFKITYNIQTNKKAETVTKVLVNTQLVEPKKIDSNTYEIQLQAPSTSGKINLNTTKFYIGDTEVDVNAENNIDVLKSPVSIEDYHGSDNLDKETVTLAFNVKDEDEAFISGKVQLIRNSDGKVEQEKNITKNGENVFEIPVTEKVEYTLKIVVKQGRDSDKQEKVTEEVLLEKPIQLIKDYNLVIGNIKSYNKNGTDSIYFEKGEKIKLSFDSTNATKFYPEYAVVNGEKYLLEKQDNTYTLELNAPNVSGETKLKIEKVYMNNAKELDISEGNVIDIEVLKSEPQVEDFAYEKTNKDTISMTFNLVDGDNALKSAVIKVSDEKGNVLKEETTKIGENSLEVELTSSEKYTASILATYDLDTQDKNSNYFENKEIFNQEMTASKDVIELKDISNITLFHKVDSSEEEIECLDVEAGMPTDLENYYVKIEMSELPTYYANVKEFRQDDETSRVFVVLDQEEFVQYQENNSKYDRQSEFSFEMPYKDENGEHPIVKKANSLFDEISKNLSGTYELTEDLDASNIDSTSVAIAGTFKGTLNGNGYKIINIPTVMFEKLNGATIKNLVIENADITNNSKGILTNAIENNSIIENVHIKDSKLSNNTNQVGGITGTVTNSSIQNCSVIGISIKANNTVGGIAGQMSSGSIVENCYVTGSIQGTISHSLGARVGGITGWDSGKLINHCYTNVNIIASSATGNGGIIGGPNGANPTITNSVSMSTGKAYRISGFNVLANTSNVYEYSESSATTNINDNNKEKVKTVTNLYDKSFYKDTLGFDENIWNLDFVENGKLPNLKSDPMPNELADYEVLENKNNIPNYEEVRKNSNYKSDNEILYYNMAKIMPYADTASWIEYGNSISNTETIATQKIKFILALNSKNELVSALKDKTSLSDIKKIKVVYENDKSQDFTVEYSKLLDNIVSIYKVKELDLQYQFDNYVANLDEDLINEIVNKANEYDYETKIAEVTTETESRLYVDYYNESVKSRIKEIIENYIITNEDLATYNSNEMLQKQISDYLTEENVINLLYAYNYYDKWYHVDFDGVILSDIMFFNGTKINSDMTSDYLINSVLNTSENNRKTSNTVTFYNNLLQSKTGNNLQNFLAYMMKTVNGYDDPNDWFADHFDGILVEQKAYGGSDEIKYRVWDIMSYRTHIMLPILTAPQEDMYIISIPSQLVLGSMNRYSTYLTKDGKERERMETLIRGYAEKIGHFYGTVASLLSNSAKQLNSTVHIQYDTRFSFPASDKVDAGTQSGGTTRDPVLKWVYEAVGSWGAANGSGAYANGTDVYWIVYQALGGDFSFSVFTHETAHNQDGRIFYGGAGRRSGTGAESHSDGNIRQEYGNGIMAYNFSYDLDITKDYTNNFSYERVNTSEKIYSYYKELFEMRYVLDYLEAQAFLRLTPEEQAKVAVQATHTTSGTSFSTKYSKLTAEDFKKMNLKTIEDLWDNQLCIRTVGTSVTASGYDVGQYGYESYYCVNWYQPHNDNGVTDCYSFKRLGQEMLGVGGYENGYVVYMSGKSSTDLDALRKITGDDTITWKQYKLNRFETVKENLSKITYFDCNEVIDKFEQALKTDGNNNNLNQSINIQALLFGIVKRATNDFADGGIYQSPTETSITSAEQLIELANKNKIGNYRLDADIDFTGIEVEEGETAYITNQFIGTLNGNGHKITGVKYPLFKSVLYADLKNIYISEPEYAGSAEAYIAITSSNSVINTIKVENSNIELPMIKTKNNRYSEYGEIEYTTKENTINSLEDLLEIGTSENGRKKKYILTTDIDLSTVSTTTQPIIPVTFIGKINGNGHTISNINATLFTALTGATIENLKIENGSISGSYAKGILANTIQSSTISKVYISGISLVSNSSNGVGGLAGGITNGNIKQVSLENISIKANNTIGVVAGQINSTIVENCIATGTITGTEWSNPNGARIGGITGWMSGGSINNCLAKVDITNSRIIGNGGIIGGPSSGNCVIKNSISLSTGEKAYRIAGWSATLGVVENIYEYEKSNSTSQITNDNNTRIKLATEANIKDSNFYKNKLGWSEDIWNFDSLSSEGYPKLK